MEFMPEWDKQEPTQDEVVQKSMGVFRMLAEAFKAKKLKGKGEDK